jgi:ABC-type Mn2+/Zn2+ transport system permease subunit
MVLSYKMDLPAGAILVVCFTTIPILMLPFLKAK